MTTVLASFIVFITKNLYQIFVLYLRCGGNDANIFSNCGKIYNSSTETCMCIRKHRIHWGSDTMMLSRTQLLLSWLSRVSTVALRAFFPLSSSSHSLAAFVGFFPLRPFLLTAWPHLVQCGVVLSAPLSTPTTTRSSYRS
jgi:hypothetical protein